MVQVLLTKLLGVGPVPNHKTSARLWLQKRGVTLHEAVGLKRKCLAVYRHCLPSDLIEALAAVEAEETGLDLGERDEDAHARLEEASPKMRAKAEHKARIARFLVSRERLGWTRAAMFKAARKEFGPDGTSDRALFRLLKAVEGVDVANFAPALLDDYHVDGNP